MLVTNRTPFEAERAVFLDERGAETLTVVVKASWELGSGGALAPAEAPDPIHPIDEFVGEPGLSSIRQEAELTPPKPHTDVLLRGCARATRPGTREMDVELRLGPILRQARVFGDRRWGGLPGVPMASRPEVFEAVPLLWENAFGGHDESARKEKHFDREARNPVGRGFRSKRSRADWRDTLLPNVEHAGQRLSRPGRRVEPMGFGPVGRDWLPRLAFAGTYDEQWMRERMPILPRDFDPRFHNAAPAEQTVPARLRGGEAVRITGCSHEGVLAFDLPRVQPVATVRIDRGSEPLPLAWDTVGIDTEARRLTILWKGSLSVHRRLMRVREIECALAGDAA